MAGPARAAAPPVLAGKPCGRGGRAGQEYIPGHGILHALSVVRPAEAPQPTAADNAAKSATEFKHLHHGGQLIGAAVHVLSRRGRFLDQCGVLLGHVVQAAN